MNHSYKKFRKYVASEKLLKSGDRVLLSLSAGKDSMFLLHMIMALSDEQQLEAGIFHLNHLTRGDESDRDELFLQQIAENHGIPFYPQRHDFSTVSSGGGSFEERAREVRYSMIEDICSTEGYDKAATAHNCNDNAETVLMRIFTGTGIYGLRGIDAARGRIIRPILSFSADEIYCFLKEKGIAWREDSSNQSSNYQRNYIRNELWPVIIGRFPDALRSITNLSSHASESSEMTEEYIRSFAGDYWSFDGDVLVIKENCFKDRTEALKFALLRRIAECFGFRLTLPIIEEILRRIGSEKANMRLYECGEVVIERKYSGAESIISVCRPGSVRQEPSDFSYPVSTEGITRICMEETGLSLVIEEIPVSEYKSAESGCDDRVYFAVPDEGAEIILRNRRPGDRIVLSGGTKKIKNLMIEKKLDSDTKKSVPLITVNGEVAAYLAGFISAGSNRISRNFWVTDDTKKMFVIYVPRT